MAKVLSGKECWGVWRDLLWVDMLRALALPRCSAPQRTLLLRGWRVASASRQHHSCAASDPQAPLPPSTHGATIALALIALCLLRRKTQLSFLSSSPPAPSVSFSPKPWSQTLGVTSHSCHGASLRSVAYTGDEMKNPKRSLWSRNLPGSLDMLGLREEMRLHEKTWNTKWCLFHDCGYCFRVQGPEGNPDKWKALACKGCGVGSAGFPS